MKKPTLYFDTSVISAYWYEGSNVAMLARRLNTREWWEFEKPHFECFASTVGETELRAGVFRKQADCLKSVRRLRFLPVTSDVRELIVEIVRLGIVPESKESDAAHLGIAAGHGVDYLLTWNYAHMANPIVQERFSALCAASSLRAPLMVSPESIPQVRFGKTIRRS
jgi:hypothetical protein